jgi:hypothetical protein
MGNQQQRCPTFPVQSKQLFGNAIPGFAVKITGRFIRK